MRGDQDQARFRQVYELFSPLQKENRAANELFVSGDNHITTCCECEPESATLEIYRLGARGAKWIETDGWPKRC